MRYAYQKIMFVISTLEQFFLFLTKIQFRLWEPETQWCVSALIADISSEVGLWKRESPRINKVKAPTDGMHRVLWKKKKEEPKTNTVSSSSGKKYLHYDSRGGMQESMLLFPSQEYLLFLFRALSVTSGFGGSVSWLSWIKALFYSGPWVQIT